MYHFRFVQNIGTFLCQYWVASVRGTRVWPPENESVR